MHFIQSARCFSRPRRKLAAISSLAAVAFFSPQQSVASLKPTDYPQQNFLLVGTVPTTIEARRSAQFKAPMNGSIELMIDATAGLAKEGALLAWMDRERLELEGDVLRLEATHHRVRDIPEKRLAALQQLRQLENRSSEIGQQLDFLGEIARKPELASLFTESVEAFNEEQVKTAEQLENEKALAERLSETLQAPENAELAEQLAEMKLQQRQLDYQKRLRDSQLRMPFDGHFRLLLPTEADRREYPVLQGDPILLAEDRSALFGVVEIKGNHWRSLPRERLLLNFPGAGALGLEETGRFDRSVMEDSGRRPSLFYYFKFEGPHLQRIDRLRGGMVTAELLLDLRDSPAYVIPKADLLAAFPRSFANGWEDGLRQHFGAIQAVHIGQHAIALTLDR